MCSCYSGILNGSATLGLLETSHLAAELAERAGGTYEGGDWRFGQVMAVTVFVPVGAEMLFAAVHGDRKSGLAAGTEVELVPDHLG